MACVLIEPVQGEGGFVVPAPGFLPALAAWCQEHGVLFVADEVQSGFCRTGAWFACEHEDGRARPGRHGQGHRRRNARWRGSPAGPRSWATSTSAASAAPSAGTRSRAPRPWPPSTSWPAPIWSGAAADRGARRHRLRSWQAELPAIGDVRGRGAMQAMEIVQPGTTVPDPAAAAAIAATCHAEGVVVLTCGTWGNVIRLLPPLTIDEVLLADGLDVLAGAARSRARPPLAGRDGRRAVSPTPGWPPRR